MTTAGSLRCSLTFEDRVDGEEEVHRVDLGSRLPTSADRRTKISETQRGLPVRSWLSRRMIVSQICRSEGHRHRPEVTDA